MAEAAKAAGKPSATAKRSRQTELKTYINFVEVSVEKKTNWLIAIPAVIIIVGLAALLSKYAVVDRFARLAEARGHAAQLQADYESKNARLHETNELTPIYYHYTWSDIDREEAYALLKERVAGILTYIAQQGISVQSASLSGDRLTLRVTGESLQQISDLSRSVEELIEVEGCTVTTAQGQETEGEDGVVLIQGGTGSRVNVVNAQIYITIRSYDEVAALEEAEG